MDVLFYVIGPFAFGALLWGLCWLIRTAVLLVEAVGDAQEAEEEMERDSA